MKTIVLIFFPLLLLGCAPTKDQLAHLDYGEAPVEYKTTIKRLLDDVLIDPESARLEYFEPRQTWYRAPLAEGSKLYSGWLVPVAVNAKNRFGGYTGKRLHGYLFRGERVILSLGPDEMSRIKL
jgi:hypothetical protein